MGVGTDRNVLLVGILSTSRHQHRRVLIVGVDNDKGAERDGDGAIGEVRLGGVVGIIILYLAQVDFHTVVLREQRGKE